MVSKSINWLEKQTKPVQAYRGENAHNRKKVILGTIFGKATTGSRLVKKPRAVSVTQDYSITILNEYTH